jgi:hypothetical protein
MACAIKRPKLRIKLSALAWISVLRWVVLKSYVRSQLMSIQHALHQTPAAKSDKDISLPIGYKGSKPLLTVQNDSSELEPTDGTSRHWL